MVIINITSPPLFNMPSSSLLSLYDSFPPVVLYTSTFQTFLFHPTIFISLALAPFILPVFLQAFFILPTFFHLLEGPVEQVKRKGGCPGQKSYTFNLTQSQRRACEKGTVYNIYFWCGKLSPHCCFPGFLAFSGCGWC